MLAAIPEAAHVWRFQVHPEVWLLVAALAGLYVWAARVVGPKVVPAGQPVLTRRNMVAAGFGIVLLWAASDWPMHDFGEEYLYAVHMVQHTLLTLVVPPLALLATPRWLADLILGQGKVRRVIRAASMPVVAGVAYNAMVMAVHWPALVNASVENGALHYVVHVVLVFTALMMWMPVCGPIEEWRMGIPAKMIYLFVMSVIPTVPGGWLTFAENAVYTSYDTPTRAFGISVQDDQQAAGVFMKLFAGSWLWFLITCQFFVWAFRHQREEEALDRAARGVRPSPAPAAEGTTTTDDDERDAALVDGPLTYEAVAEAFAATAPAPEPGTRRP
ncbi:MAG TPA: cytochrome c oxidase assembly protein [Iamia sp.]|nr:cytochrome c oxidase assembly protein [Iamia sp.]